MSDRVELIEPDGPGAADTGRPAPPETRTRLIGVVILVGLVVAGTWAIAAAGGPDRDRDDEAAPADTRPPAPATEQSPPTTVEPTSGRIASGLLAGLGSQGRVSFLTTAGVTTIALDTGVVTHTSPRVEAVGDLDARVVVGDGARSVAVARDDPTDAVLLGTVGEVVKTGTAFVYTLIAETGGGTELFVGGLLEGFRRGLEVPDGAEVLGVPRLGVLVMPATGGTYLASIEGYERISTSRALAATESLLLVTECDEALSCGGAVVPATTADSGPRVEVAATLVEGGADLSLSPDGRFVLRTAPGSVSLVPVEGDTAFTAEVSGSPRAAWAPDSSFAVWLDPEASVLEVLEISGDEPAVFRLGLASLGTGILPDSEVVVYERE